jgi:hypothetical protein
MAVKGMRGVAAAIVVLAASACGSGTGTGTTGTAGQVGTTGQAGHQGAAGSATGAAGSANGTAGSASGTGGGSAVCIQPGSACVNSCCTGAICVTDGTTSVCAAQCTAGTDCSSGCCASLQDGRHVCSPPDRCQAAPTCLQPGATCVSKCCAGALCVTDGTTSLCAAICAVGTDCNSGCCAPLQDGSHVCAPASQCQPPDPCAQFDDCVSSNPPPIVDNPPCSRSDSRSTTVTTCATSSSCPGGDCTQCTMGTTWCAGWATDQASCDAYVASIGAYNSGRPNALRAARAMWCGP